MKVTARLFATLIFVTVAIFLATYTWVPARNGLRFEEARVIGIVPQSNTWHEVEILTANGKRITCRARRGWPVAGLNRCPIEKFERWVGGSVSVLHDGRLPYEVVAGGELVIDYSAHRRVQMVAIALAALMLAMAGFVWRRK